jgi:hypothetical protein
MLEREEPGSGTLGIAADAPVVLWYRVERTSSRAGVAPAGVRRLSRRTFSPTIVLAVRKLGYDAL